MGHHMQKKTDFTLNENESLPFKVMIIHDVPSQDLLRKLVVIRRSYPIGVDAKGKPLTILRPYRQLNVELLVYKKGFTPHTRRAGGDEFTIVYNVRLKIHVSYEANEDIILEINDTHLETDKDTTASVKEQIMGELRLHGKFIDDKFKDLVVSWSIVLEQFQPPLDGPSSRHADT